MAKVLSTKLKVDELDRFTAMAEQRGETKAGLLKRLVLDYVDSGGKLDSVDSAGGILPTAPSKKRLTPERTNEVDSAPVSQNPTSKDSLLVYRADAKGRPEASAKSSANGGWLLLLLLFALRPKPQPSIAVDRSSAHTTQSPQVDAYGLYAHRVGNTTVYTSSPTPFW